MIFPGCFDSPSLDQNKCMNQRDFELLREGASNQASADFRIRSRKCSKVENLSTTSWFLGRPSLIAAVGCGRIFLRGHGLWLTRTTPTRAGFGLALTLVECRRAGPSGCAIIFTYRSHLRLSPRSSHVLTPSAHNLSSWLSLSDVFTPERVLSAAGTCLASRPTPKMAWILAIFVLSFPARRQTQRGGRSGYNTRRQGGCGWSGKRRLNRPHARSIR